MIPERPGILKVILTSCIFRPFFIIFILNKTVYHGTTRY